jgi:two-component system KDP operon response regulator KdpE
MSNIFQDTQILVVDDDSLLLVLISSMLQAAGSEVITARNGVEGLQILSNHQPDLVILDVLMPELDGLEFCRPLRQHSQVPVIMLTALDQNEMMVSGLDVGADDYVIKPFVPEVLLARIRAVLRRANPLPIANRLAPYDDGYLNLNPATGQVQVQGKTIKLSKTEYKLLLYLFQQANRLITWQQILVEVWGVAYQNSPDYAHTYIRKLRQKLEPDPKKPRYLLTQHSIGCRFKIQT